MAQKNTTACQVLVAFQKEWLTGLSAGRKAKAWVVANSRASARKTAKELRETKVFASEIGNDLYKVSKVKVVPFTKTLDL